MTTANSDMAVKRLKDQQRQTARKLRHRAAHMRKMADELDGLAALMTDAPAAAKPAKSGARADG